MLLQGRAKLYVDGKLAIDNWTTQRPGDFFYGYVIRIFKYPALILANIDKEQRRRKQQLICVPLHPRR